MQNLGSSVPPGSLDLGIPKSQKELSQLLDRLAEQIFQLSGRIEPIMRKKESKENNDKIPGVAISMRAPLEEYLNSETHKVSMMIELVEDDLARLEI